MKSKGIIITGSTGYLGSKILNLIDENLIFILYRKSFDNNQTKFFDLKNKEKILISENYDGIIVVHLATFFSKDPNDKEFIHKANIEFGKKLLASLEKTNVEKIIYTNTMFSYYPDESIRTLDYTKTKNEFSTELNNFTKKNNILYDEIFLDNTFGGIDKRKKALPLIVDAVLNQKPSPIKDEQAYINLVSYKDILNRIYKSITTDIYGSTAFVNEKRINLQSVYEFLNKYNLNKIEENNILQFKPNIYLKNSPSINLFGLKLNDIQKELVNYLNTT